MNLNGGGRGAENKEQEIVISNFDQMPAVFLSFVLSLQLLYILLGSHIWLPGIGEKIFIVMKRSMQVSRQ
jgi:hypothetical protein